MSDERPSVEILPGVGIAGARFGEQRSLHRARLGPHESFERTPETGVIDSYGDGIMLSYDDSDLLDFIEIASSVPVTWDGVSLTGQPLGIVLRALAERGLQAEFDGDSSYEYPAQGVGLFTTAPDELAQPVEGVSIFPAEHSS